MQKARPLESGRAALASTATATTTVVAMNGAGPIDRVPAHWAKMTA